MHYYRDLNMGEGIAGSNNVGAATSVLYSCIAIAFVNQGRQWGGLYHYPSSMMRNPNVAQTVHQMASDIQPDQIVITPAARMAMHGGGSVDHDIEDVRRTLAIVSPGAKITVTKPSTSAQFFWVDGAPVFNVQPHNLEPPIDDENMSLPDFRIIMSHSPRRVHGNALYYGGDGETSGVLGQGVAPATDHPAMSSGLRRSRIRKTIQKRCIIM